MTACAKITTHSHNHHHNARTYADTLVFCMQAGVHTRTCTHTHTHIAEAVDCICPSSSGSVVAAPAASPPHVTFDSHGGIHHLLGSLGASQLPPGGFAADGSREALGLKPSPQLFAAAAVRETDRGAAQM